VHVQQRLQHACTALLLEESACSWPWQHMCTALCAAAAAAAAAGGIHLLLAVATRMHGPACHCCCWRNPLALGGGSTHARPCVPLCHCCCWRNPLALGGRSTRARPCVLLLLLEESTLHGCSTHAWPYVPLLEEPTRLCPQAETPCRTRPQKACTACRGTRACTACRGMVPPSYHSPLGPLYLCACSCRCNTACRPCARSCTSTTRTTSALALRSSCRPGCTAGCCTTSGRLPCTRRKEATA